MSKGVDYSKWDRMDFSSSDDDDDDDKNGANEYQPRVTTLNEPSRVTRQANGTVSVANPTAASFPKSTKPTTAATTTTALSRKEATLQTWMHNGESHESSKLYWCQNRHDIVLRYALPDGCTGKDVAVTCCGSSSSSSSTKGKHRQQQRSSFLLDYKDRYCALSQPQIHGTGTNNEKDGNTNNMSCPIDKSLILLAKGLVLLQGDLPYPCFLTEDDQEGCVDWTVESSSWGVKYIVITLHKAVPMEGVTMWWSRILQQFPERDVSNMEGRTDRLRAKDTKGQASSPSPSSFQDAWEQAHVQFKEKIKTSNREPQQHLVTAPKLPVATAAGASGAASSVSKDPKGVHELVVKRYNDLRRKGTNKKEAMHIARNEYGLDQQDCVNVGMQVANMFGMSQI